MEFYIKRNSTLPKLQVEVLNESRNGYNQLDPLISTSVVTFSMKDVKTGVFKIANAIASVVPNKDGSGYILSYQFSKKNTNKNGNYSGYFKITNERGVYEVPIESSLLITVSDSFADSEMCCHRNRVLNEITINDNHSDGSVISDYVATSKYPVDTKVEITFKNTILMVGGRNIENDVILSIEKGFTSGTYRVVSPLSYDLVTGESYYEDIKVKTSVSSPKYRFIVEPKSIFTPNPIP